MKKICIIGGSGFVGTRLIALLHPIYSLTNIDKRISSKFPELTILGDIRDKDFLINKLKGYDMVVLLAAEHRDDLSPVSLYYDVNVTGLKNVLEAMVLNNITKIIFTSSVAVYGLNKVEPNENSPVDPFNHYGKSKWQAEEVLRGWYQKNVETRSLTIIRPTVIFGESNRGNVYKLLKQIALKRFIMIGSGKNHKSMSYVENVTAFIDYSIKNNNHYQLFNYVDKPDSNMLEIIEQVELSLKIKVPPLKIPYFIGMFVGYFFDVLALVTRKKYDISSIRIKKFCATTSISGIKLSETSFVAPFTIYEGLDRTMKHEFLDKNGRFIKNK
jgi:nucleoside-diphosphate-sugar epimerase